MDIYLFGHKFIEKVFKFYDFTSFYYIWAHSDWDTIKTYSNALDSDFLENLVLPLGPLTKQFSRIPEVFMKTVHDHMVFVWEFKPNMLMTSGPGITSTLAFDIAAVMSKNFKNPHLRAQMTIFMSFFAPLIGHKSFKEEEHLVWNVLTEHPVALRYLLPTLIEAYGDVEKTGSRQ